MMDIYFDTSLALKYKSQSQAARVMTEEWVKANMFCPRCGNPRLSHFKNNRKVADFFCSECKNEYELKSKQGKIGHRVADGAYNTFIERITSDSNPDFFVMSYNATAFCVENLWMIPKHFFIPSIVEKRKPLSASARRAGWVGCNIIFDEVPEQGRISIIKNRIPVCKKAVIKRVSLSSRLETANLESRGWLFDVLHCINQLQKSTFSLNDIYQFEYELKRRYPNNNNIRPKIRQQLQVLRDKGFLEFIDRGVYRLIELPV